MMHLRKQTSDALPPACLPHKRSKAPLRPSLRLLVTCLGRSLAHTHTHTHTHPLPLQVNYLGHYALTRLLEDTLQASAPARVGRARKPPRQLCRALGRTRCSLVPTSGSAARALPSGARAPRWAPSLA